MSGKHNEDSYGIFAWQLENGPIMHLGVVADGVGGQIAGEVASRLTIETVADYFDSQETVNNYSGHLEQSILAANEAVFEEGQKNPDYKGMSTTIAMAAIIDNHLYTAHIGDSRIYLLRDDNLKQISIDHTWAQEAIEAGLLTREQAKTHPNRNVIKRHLGGKLQIEVDHRLALNPGQSNDEAHENQGTALQPGDTVLICSDGLTDMISDESALESLNNHFEDLTTATHELIDKANQAGGRDNITVVLLQVPGAGVVPAATTLIEHAPAAAVVEPTLITAAPKTISRRKPAAAAAQPVQEKGRSKMPILLLIIGGIILLIILAVGAFFIFGDQLNPIPTETPTPEPTAVPETPLPTNTPGSPATAAFLETAASSTENSQGGNPDGTAEGVPTLRPTLTPSVTPTRTRVPPPLSTTTSPSTATSEAPATPTTQTQSTQPPQQPTQPPATQPPATQPPATQPPATQPPVTTQTPARNTPVSQTTEDLGSDN
jgi:protein phosphatase